jgi:hypothetical protein
LTNKHKRKEKKKMAAPSSSSGDEFADNISKVGNMLAYAGDQHSLQPSNNSKYKCLNTNMPSTL